MSEELERCPCGSADIAVENGIISYFACCKKCGITGPDTNSWGGAIAEWNRRFNEGEDRDK